MTIDEMIAKKKEYGFSCEYIAQKAGVPFSTVQKVFSKLTPAPRRKTIEALKIFFESLESNSAPNISCCNVMKHEDTLETAYVCEESMEYGSVSGTSALKSDMYDMSEISSEKSVNVAGDVLNSSLSIMPIV